ncbi:arylsulfatase [Aestuariibaculum suncheonense]|uniref:Arylsulfatase n=1 Tax=Aestuariibaculum suncheonense TaxID=1028745 RepID=A0A8J6UK41_9FLAO|nr:arylsulfatase [Aestuariibaculum suncheonense]MBD0835381.1 arylsulfatase [Aestuariibaculum suncheonense]
MINNVLKSAVIFIITLVFSIPFSSAQSKSSKKKNKPNVIYIMADDLGPGMLSYYGQKYFTTPNIDKIAEQGIVFNNSYSSTFCAPSRATFITGYNDCRENKYVLTSGKGYKEAAIDASKDKIVQNRIDAVIGIEPDITYLPQVFKAAGYVTGEIGKLDYGFLTTAKQMNNHGWDYHYGYYDHTQCHGFYPMFLHENGNRISIPGNTHPDAAKTGESGSDEQQEQARWDMNGKTVYSQDLFLNKMLEFIRTNKENPFFLYHPTQLPHGPVAIPAIHPEIAFNDDLTQIEKAYASMVKRLDDDLGIIINELDALGIADNTMIIFSSDNGHELYYNYKDRTAKPYRNMQTGQPFNNITDKFYSEIGGDIFDGNNGQAGLKRSNWNGGVKVPLFIYWPNKIKPGQTSDKLVANYDFMTTMADMLGVNIQENKDGTSYYNTLLNKKQKSEEQHTSIAFGSFMGPALITHDGWKLRYFAPKNIFQLYYIPDDYKEENDVSNEYPEKVKALTSELIEKCDGNLDNGWISYGRHFKFVN